MNTNANKDKNENYIRASRSVTTCMAVGVLAFIAMICLLLVLLLIYGWQLVQII